MLGLSRGKEKTPSDRQATTGTGGQCKSHPAKGRLDVEDDTRLKTFYEGLAELALSPNGPGVSEGVIDGVTVYGLSGEWIEKHRDLGPLPHTHVVIREDDRACYLFRGDS
jgi:predicted Rdx family selenoprotein